MPNPDSNGVRWRFADFISCSGRWSMAADSFLYRTIDRHPQPIIVRFYRFEPPAITIGYHQTASRAIDLVACAKTGIEIARRPTGGRALLHRQEINYAVIADTARARIFGSGLAAGFWQISTAVAEGLHQLGVRAEVSDDRIRPGNRSTQRGSGLCAATTTRYEITCSGRKIAAAAQLRSAGRLLQHGTIYLNEEEITPVEFFGATAKRTDGKMVSLHTVLGHYVNYDIVIQALKAGFLRKFGHQVNEIPFNNEERIDIAAVAADSDNLRL